MVSLVLISKVKQLNVNLFFNSFKTITKILNPSTFRGSTSLIKDDTQFNDDFPESTCNAFIPGGGSAKMWSSMLEKNLVWNGGSKIEKLCGIVWTQNGGEIVRVGVIWV